MIRLFKHFLTFLFTSVLLWNGVAQESGYGNEWIVDGQEYFKISTYRTGIYKLSYQQLKEAGVPLASIDASRIQLFHRGKEVSIDISGGEDGVFNSTDTLIFWGKANDGTLDSLLYKPHSAQSNKHLNLYSDTTAYFLTWGTTAGKRMPNVSGSEPLPAGDLYVESLLLFKENYEPGEVWSESRLSSFSRGEGWSSGPIVKGAAAASGIRTFDIPIHAPVAGKKAFLDMVLYGFDQNPHVTEILLGNPASPDTIIQVPLFTGNIDQKVYAEFPSSFLTASPYKISVRTLGSAGVADRVSVPFIKLVYPSGADMAGKSSFSFQRVNIAPDQNYSISSFPEGARIYDVTDGYDLKVIEPASVSGTDITFAAHSGAGSFYINSTSDFLTPVSVRKVELNGLHLSNPAVSSAEFLIITHPKLYQAALAYSSYRTETGYSTLIALTSDLYNQFSYGEVTPLAIHNFCRYMADSVQPKYLFIIGKALDINYRSANGKWYRWDPASYTSLSPSNSEYVDCLVPTGGYPTSDLIYSMGKGGADDYVPAFPVGRLHAKNQDEVYAYLEKVIQHEALADTLLWRKHVLHLSGGGNQHEIDIFKLRMQNLAPMVRDSVFGGRVIKHIVKRRGFYVDDELIAAVAPEVNKGVSYITFLGHASPTFPDLDVGFVSNRFYGYNNEGKYPLLILNGCNVVNASSPRSLAEDWLQTPKKGAIAAMGHSHMGYTGLLEIYTRRMYKYLFNTRMVFEQNYGLGDVQKLAIIDQLSNNTIYNQAMMEQYLLQGDPSIRIYVPEKPDYAIAGVTVQALDNLPVTALSDSFALKIVVPDFGITSPDSVKITVSRTIGTNIFHYDTLLYRSVFYQDTLLFIIRNTGAEDFGMNTFTVSVDPGNEVAEMNELNNSYSFQFFIPHTVVQPLFPKEFSIVNSQPVVLTAQATNILAGTTGYYLELDTTYSFNSPFKKSAVINAGGLIRWEQELLPDIAAYDSTVYFWRVRFNTIPANEDTIWGESSFTYIKDGPEGWSQSDFAEFRKDKFTDLEYHLKDESLTFPKTEIWVSAGSPGNKYVGPDPTQSSTYWAGLGLNGDPIIYENRGGCGTGIYAITFDKSTILPYYPIPSYPTCGRFWSGKRINSFTQLNNTSLTGARTQGGLINYLEAVKPGDYVLLMSVGNAQMDVWSDTLKNQMKAVLGAEFLDSLKNEMPYIILARKGAGETLYEQYGAIDEIIYLDYHLEGRLNNGSIVSTTIGPASSWSTLYKTFHLEPSDTVITGIVGVNLSGSRDTLYHGIVPDEFDISGIDAGTYPYIQLFTQISDSTFQTPAEIKKWQVLNSGVPEGTLDPYKFGVDNYKAIVAQEGQEISVDFNFYNISSKDFSDSLRVKVSLIDVSTGHSTVSWLDLPKLTADHGVDFNYSFNSIGHVGSYILQVYVNPQLQPEEFYHNNVIEIPVTIKEDKTNPVLDVTFDGIHIIDGDIVSPDPMIAISLRDENPYLMLDDTTGMELYLKKPCAGCDFEPINFSDPEILSWGQSSATGNKFRIEYNPKNLPDGIYTLLVQGADVSGNKSGMQPYKISFEVINESSITNFYPYPNPFSTSTRFVFTLTGSKVPDDLKIQIMTVTGKVVREIRKEELGPVRIGNNISDFSWDGTDQFGDRLANGVYLYRVIIKDGADFSHRETAGDKAFHKNFGKLYLLK